MRIHCNTLQSRRSKIVALRDPVEEGIRISVQRPSKINLSRKIAFFLFFSNSSPSSRNVNDVCIENKESYRLDVASSAVRVAVRLSRIHAINYQAEKELANGGVSIRGSTRRRIDFFFFFFCYEDTTITFSDNILV